jgi:flagellar FliL protein
LKKKILLAVIALIVLGVLGGGGFAAWRWYSGRKAAQAAAAAPTPAPAAAAAPTPAPAAAAAQDDDDDAPAAGGGEEGAAGPPVLVLKQLIVNLESQRKNAFLKCDLHILFRNPELGKLATSDKPTAENSIIRALVLKALSGKTVEEASDVETREALRQEIKDELNEKFASRHTPEELAKAKKTGKPPKPPIKDVLVVDWAIQQ